MRMLLLKSSSNKSIVNEIEYVKCLYKDDLEFDQLVVELKMLKSKMNEKNENFICFENLRHRTQPQ